MKKQEEELKTLKDCNDLEEARAEAIKWIDNEKTLRMNANDFILVFFNITEEDLKEEKA